MTMISGSFAVSQVSWLATQPLLKAGPQFIPVELLTRLGIAEGVWATGNPLIEF